MAIFIFFDFMKSDLLIASSTESSIFGPTGFNLGEVQDVVYEH